MAAYLIAIRESSVKDPEALAEYSRMNRENAEKSSVEYGIKPLVAYGALDVLEGQAPDGIVMIEFPSVEKAKAWYDSPEYQTAVPFRKKAADYRIMIVEGL